MKLILISLMLPICACAAPSETGETTLHFGDWRIVTHPKAKRDVAFVKDNNDGLTGVLCDKKSTQCHVFLSAGTSCDKNIPTVSIGVNTALGAFSASALCFPSIGELLIFVDYDRMIDALGNGGDISYSVPLHGGAFRYLRFSTVGFTPAIKQLRAIQKNGASNHKTTKMM